MSVTANSSKEFFKIYYEICLSGFLICTLSVSKALFRPGVCQMFSVKIMDSGHSNRNACYIKFLMHPACICHIQTETTTVIKGTHSLE